MRLREFLLNTTLMLFAASGQPTLNGNAAFDPGIEPAAPESSAPALPAVPSPLIEKDKVLGTAYYDTLSILGTANACSAFFGGPEASVPVFNKLVGQMRKQSFAPSLGIRMSGETVNFLNAQTNKEYRLFDRVTINEQGPFYRKRFSFDRPKLGGIGSFEADTKEVRVLMFLHELGHLIKGQDGKWLLPDDGQSAETSRSNSEKIEEVCKEQIRNVGKEKAAITHAEKLSE